MIVGKKASLDALAGLLASLEPTWLDSKEEGTAHAAGIALVSVNTLSRLESLSLSGYDILILIQPDELTKSHTSQTYQQLLRIKARLRLCVYTNDVWQAKTRGVQWPLVGIRSEQVARYAIMNADEPVPRLPAPYPFTATLPEARRAGGGFAAISIDGDAHAFANAPQKGIPIPPRPQNPFAATGTPFRTAYESSEQRFVKAARAYVDKTERMAAFVPFMAYWPTYESMTNAQTRWYFYWRAQVRMQRYPQTDLSYIFLYLYELLNLVGCETPKQGYDTLMAVWKAYRAAFPKLNVYLGNWAVDFVLLHELDVPLREVLSLCGSARSGELLELELYSRFCAEPVDMTVELLTHAADYDITRSKFYQSAHAPLVRSAIPKVLSLVDAYLKKQQGQRIIDLFAPGQIIRTRYLYRGAVYAEPVRELKVSVVPLSSHGPLREFLAQVMRCAENKLREITGFCGQAARRRAGRRSVQAHFTVSGTRIRVQTTRAGHAEGGHRRTKARAAHERGGRNAAAFDNRNGSGGCARARQGKRGRAFSCSKTPQADWIRLRN